MNGLAGAPGSPHGARGRTGGFARGFSMVELLVTIVLAGIIFAAMVPLFVNAMKTTSGDKNRITATNLAQDRLEKIRLLAANGQYGDISSSDSTKLSSSSFANGQFGPTASVNGKAYQISYDVTPYTSTTPNYKNVVVTVAWSGGQAPVTASTIVTDPTVLTYSSGSGSPTPTPSPSSTTGYYTLTVTVTAADCTSAGVTVTRTDCTPNVLQVPNVQIPTAANGLQVAWTGLAGGPNIIYHVIVHFTLNGKATTHDSYVTLTDDTPIFFDTLN